MPNQYSKTDGGRLYGGNLPSKFSVMLSPELAETWANLARQVGRDKAELFRELIGFTAKRVKEFYEQYPDHYRMGLYPVLENYYDAGKVALEQEHTREYRLLQDYQEAKRLDGGKVNYELNSRAMSFYLKAWGRGLSVKELLQEFAEVEKTLPALAERSRPALPEPGDLDDLDASPAGEPLTLVPSGALAPEEDLRPVVWGLLVVIGILLLALVGLLLFYPGGIWAK